HPALPVADRDQRVEAEAPASLHDLGDAVDRDHVLDQAVALALALALVAPRAPPATAAPPRPPRPPRPPGAPGAPGAPGPTRPTRPTRSGRWCARRLRPARVRGGWLRGALGPLLLFVRHQNSNPPLRAPSATALTRPWYW